MSTVHDGKLLRFKEDYVVGLRPVESGGVVDHRIKMTSPRDIFLVVGVEVFTRHALFHVMVDGEAGTIASPYNLFDARHKITTKMERLNPWLMTIAEEVG
jgi:hypothetical protein